MHFYANDESAERIIRRKHHVGVRDNQGGVRSVRPNDFSVLFGAMDSAINWNQAEGNPLADRNPYVGPQAVGDGVFARLLAAIDNFTAVPSMFIDGGDHVVVLGRYGGTMKNGAAPIDSLFLRSSPVLWRQGRDVPAGHGHCAVDAIDDMTEERSRSEICYRHFDGSCFQGRSDRPRTLLLADLDAEPVTLLADQVVANFVPRYPTSSSALGTPVETCINASLVEILS